MSTNTDNCEVRTEVPGYRITDPGTSAEAFKKVCVPQREQDVLDALLTLGGMGSTEEIADLLSDVYKRDESPSNLSPRIRPLIRKGLVEETAMRRKSRQGRLCTVWALTLEGQHRSRQFTVQP